MIILNMKITDYGAWLWSDDAKVLLVDSQRRGTNLAADNCLNSTKWNANIVCNVVNIRRSARTSCRILMSLSAVLLLRSRPRLFVIYQWCSAIFKRRVPFRTRVRLIASLLWTCRSVSSVFVADLPSSPQNFTFVLISNAFWNRNVAQLVCIAQCHVAYCLEQRRRAAGVSYLVIQLNYSLKKCYK